MMTVKNCEHIRQVVRVKNPEHYRCNECAGMGGRWVHLRTCQECGVTLCCDSSPNRHAHAHFHQTGHPVIASAEPGENWLWCYHHNLLTPY